MLWLNLKSLRYRKVDLKQQACCLYATESVAAHEPSSLVAAAHNYSSDNQTHHHPLNAAKNASDVLVDFIDQVEADDRIGLSLYTHTNADGALLESGLTFDVLNVKPLYRDRQAGHYDNMTNIGGGIKVARDELEANARTNAYKVIVVMTDGVANRPLGNPIGFTQQQADLCFDAGIKILTVSLGLGADQTLMQDIADRTGGKHFNVPGGGTIAEYEAELMAVFQEIAADRPLKLLPGPPD